MYVQQNGFRSLRFSGTLWRHIVRLFTERKQDGVIFVGTEGNKNGQLLEKLVSMIPRMFRTDCPVIMPLKYSSILDLKLDSHVILYRKGEDETYRLIDKFSVQGGAPIILELGTWDKTHGVILEKRINTWERRIDLLGAELVNVFHVTPIDGNTPIYGTNGSIIGSEGWYQDILFYIVGRLNLSVKTIALKNADNCWDIINRDTADVCSDPLVHNLDAFGSIPISIQRTTDTLLAGVRTGSAQNMKVFAEVFGFWEWFAIFAALAVIAILWPIMQLSLESNQQRPPLYEGLVTVSLFLIQNGNQPVTRFWARRVLALTTSMLTLLVFVCYSNDITSEMTAGPPPLNVHTFDDVLDQGFEVIVVGYEYWSSFQESKSGTSQHAIYKQYFQKYEGDILAYFRFVDSQTAEEIEAGVEYDKINKVPHWFFETEKNLNWAAERIMNEENTLWYHDETAKNWNAHKGKVISLKMEAAHYTYLGFALQRDSEFMAVFNHYLLKTYENGILNRLDLLHNGRPDIKIGLNEPEPLGMDNVIFPFLLLAASFVTSTVIAVMEKLLKKVALKREVNNSKLIQQRN